MEMNGLIKIPKYELIMVLKENETLRNKMSKYKWLIREMNQKMGMENFKYFLIIIYRANKAPHHQLWNTERRGSEASWQAKERN